MKPTLEQLIAQRNKGLATAKQREVRACTVRERSLLQKKKAVVLRSDEIKAFIEKTKLIKERAQVFKSKY